MSARNIIDLIGQPYRLANRHFRLTNPTCASTLHLYINLVQFSLELLLSSRFVKREWRGHIPEAVLVSLNYRLILFGCCPSV